MIEFIFWVSTVALADPNVDLAAKSAAASIFGEKPNPVETFQAGIFTETLVLKNPRECKKLRGVRAQKLEVEGVTYSSVDGADWFRFCLAVAHNDRALCQNVLDGPLRARCTQYFQGVGEKK